MAGAGMAAVGSPAGAGIDPGRAVELVHVDARGNPARDRHEAADGLSKITHGPSQGRDRLRPGRTAGAPAC